ncbi:MAG TPA: hypothetical protein VNQ80_07615 [Parapedobacter sp.]|uniref:hypothetical protein n=1 Tax=Parapedobacter sp. TaxID=1958893 RepID=UPI002B8C8CAA|nr:hypothetical protein [Parapedobacter sp.]HWK57188.1 hypothetical protein [Parapedobacter sp.]
MSIFFKICHLFVVMITLRLDSACAQLQYERKGMVEKEALLVYLVGGQNILVPSLPPAADSIDAQGKAIKRFTMGSAEDYFSYQMLPNDKKLRNGDPIPIALHFRDLVGNNPYIYMFNDVYLSSVVNGSQNEFYHSIGHTFSGAEPEPQIDMDELKVSNDVFIWYNRSYVGKFWVLKGEWEAFEVNEKPTFLQGITPNTLQFDHYNVFLLKKIISIEPVTKVVGKPDVIEAVEGQIPSTKPKN